MPSVIVIAPFIAPTIAVWAVVLELQFVSPGTEWSAVLATLSLYAAAFGAVYTYEAREISKQMKATDEAREKRRKDALANHEIPHILQSLKMTLLGMDATALALRDHAGEGLVTDTRAEYLYRRAMMHIGSIRALETNLLDADLSAHYALLDGAIVNLEGIAFTPRDAPVDTEKFEESMMLVFHVMQQISEQHGVEP